MPVTTSNIYGKISISDEAISKVAAHAALECYGVVEMVSKKLSDSFSQLFKRDSGGKGVKVVTTGDRIYIVESTPPKVVQVSGMIKTAKS